MEKTDSILTIFFFCFLQTANGLESSWGWSEKWHEEIEKSHPAELEPHLTCNHFRTNFFHFYLHVVQAS